MSDVPRRVQMLEWVPAEHAISQAIQVVEDMGADERLTAAVIKLGEAKDAVADYVDDVKPEPREGGFCTRCGTKVETFEGLQRCPACNTDSVPCAWSDQVTISVNWHELRCLVMWAERWTGSSDEMKDAHYVVYQIARRLAAQYPGRAPLTFAGELGDLAAEYDVSVVDPKLRQDIAEQTGREVNLFRPREDRP